METSKNIHTAFFAAQQKMRNATKGSDNPFFNSRYADLNSVREAVMPALAEEGIYVMQPSVSIDGRNYVTTRLVHAESNTYVEATVEIVVSRSNDPQAMGSAITYARRYGLQSLCAIGADDDDGNAAAAKTAKSTQADLDREIAEDDVLRQVANTQSIDELNTLWREKKSIFQNQNRLTTACATRKKELSK